MNAWTFLSSLDSTTLIVVLIIALVAVLAIVFGVIIAVHRLTWFVMEFARLPKSRRRRVFTLVMQALKAVDW